MPLWAWAVQGLVALDRRFHHLPRRALGLLLIALFLAGFALMLHAWFVVMQPYPE